MEPLESMYSKLKSTCIYSLSGHTLVDCELQTYAEGLNLAYDALAQLEKESFTATASDYGLTLREQQLGIHAHGDTVERRAAILNLCAVTPVNFTRGDVQRALNAAGLNCEICENTAAQKLYINCPAEDTDQTAQDSAMKIANLFLPAHLNAELDFRSISWNNIDQEDDTFDARDGLDLAWDSIDCYENAVLQI